MSLDNATLDTLVSGAESTATADTSPAEGTESTSASSGAQPTVKPEEKPKADFKTPWPDDARRHFERKSNQLKESRKQYEELQKNIGDEKWLREQLKKFEPAAASDPNDPQPDIAKYQDWVKYNQDLTAWNLRQLQKQQQPKQEAPKADPKREEWVQERSKHVTDKTREMLTAHPEYLPVFQQNQDLLDDLPEATKDILLASDNAALAVLQMAHEGTIHDLPDMAPRLAQKVILKAIADGAALIGAATPNEDGDGETQAPNTVSRAPAPMRESKTSKSGAKDPTKMSDDEFRSAFMTR